MLSTSASVKDGKLTLTIANLSFDRDIRTEISPVGGCLGSHAVVTVLAADDVHSHNTFAAPGCVTPLTAVYNDWDGRITVPHGGVVTVVADCEM